jgi:outer membrane lipoprotein-sorting protein
MKLNERILDLAGVLQETIYGGEGRPYDVYDFATGEEQDKIIKNIENYEASIRKYMKVYYNQDNVPNYINKKALYNYMKYEDGNNVYVSYINDGNGYIIENGNETWFIKSNTVNKAVTGDNRETVGKLIIRLERYLQEEEIKARKKD